MSSMVWPCFVARVPMTVAMLPEPMMLMVVMTCAPLLCMDQLVVGVLLACGPGCRRFAGAQVSDRPADDLVNGLALAGLVVETGAAADQGTADDGTRPEGARGPPIADRETVHGGADDGGARAQITVAVSYTHLRAHETRHDLVCR